MSVGYLTHLTLDEIYSVDVMDTRIKASFGTALKLVDTKHWGHTSAMAAATVLVFLLTPPTKIFVENITSRALWTDLHHRLLPQDHKWFQGMAWVLDAPPRSKAGIVPGLDQPDLHRIDPAGAGIRTAQGAVCRDPRRTSSAREIALAAARSQARLWGGTGKASRNVRSSLRMKRFSWAKRKLAAPSGSVLSRAR